ncbi:MAG: hypothetical protein KAI59_04875 [Planctomycetes bacterium]|nr:hypothetical protein [Planctomycetota bacterium]
MNKKIAVFVLLFFLSATALARTTALRDGFVLSGVDGKLTIADSNDKYFFQFEEDINDDRVVIKSGVEVELLESSALEKIIADANSRATKNYRLWGKITTYRDKNFIFPIYFLPISEPEAVDDPNSTQSDKVAVNESNDILEIPEEIVAKLTQRKIIQVEELEEGLELKQDSMLVDRTGFICETDGEMRFVLDALGRNLSEISFPLLKGEILDLTEQQQLVWPDRLKFKAAGIVTKYKGQHYLLLQRATRSYSHGNFGH